MMKKLLCVLIALMVTICAGAEKVPFDSVYKNLKPTLYWKYFREISAVPRACGHMDKIVAYMKDFAVKNNLKAIVDEYDNVIIRVPATKGYENRTTLILQAHMDTVSALAPGYKHDFENEGRKLYVEGDYVKAEGTNVGADDGMGVAEVLSVIADKNLKHGPIEAVLTANEDIGMLGALGMKPNTLEGDYMLNLDGGPCMGGGGGVTTKMIYDINYTNTPKNVAAFNLTISGLAGGHSAGVGAGMANAVKEIANLLYNLQQKYDINVASINGGTEMNVVPSTCTAVVTVANDQKENFLKDVNYAQVELKGIYFNTDPKLKLTATIADTPSQVILKDQQEKMVKALVSCFAGVFRTNSAYHVVETSTNLGVIKTEKKQMTVTTMQRSSVEYAKKEIANTVSAPFVLIGAKIEQTSDFASWQPQPNSAIVKLVEDAFTKKLHRDAKFRVSHAGFECGVLASKAKKKIAAASMGALGPDAHKPTERLNIPSAMDQDLVVKYVIENMPVKGEK
jgi:dipeptidase D